MIDPANHWVRSISATAVFSIRRTRRFRKNFKLFETKKIASFSQNKKGIPPETAGECPFLALDQLIRQR
jgi:hypothetical protein